MIKRKILIIVFVLVLNSFYLSNVFASAFSKGIWYGASCVEEGDSGPSKSCSLCDLFIILKNIGNILVEISFIVASLVFVIGGIIYMTSLSSPNLVKKALETIKMAFFGLLIVLFFWTIISTLLHILAGDINFPWYDIKCKESEKLVN